MASSGLKCVAIGVAVVLAGGLRAECTRPISVPVAPVGLSVTVQDEQVGGVYPEVLRGLGTDCQFEFAIVPRARLEALFESGRADLLVPASRSPRRDQHGLFVPLVQARPTLISLNSDRPALRSLQDLLARRELRVTLVRGYDYGAVYQSLMQELRAQKRLSLEVDPVSVARALEAGLADVTIMAPAILHGALSMSPRVQHLQSRLRVEPVDELPWNDSGLYISKKSMGEADRVALLEMLDRAARSGVTWRTFTKYYPQAALEGSIRPR